MKVTQHACERYIDRVKPYLTVKQARAELERLLEMGTVRGQPCWHKAVHVDEESVPDFYVELSDGIACPVRDGWVITVLTRAGMTEGSRSYRNRKKKQRRQAVRLRSSMAQGAHIRAREGKANRAKSRRLPPDVAA